MIRKLVPEAGTSPPLVRPGRPAARPARRRALAAAASAALLLWAVGLAAPVSPGSLPAAAAQPALNDTTAAAAADAAIPTEDVPGREALGPEAMAKIRDLNARLMRDPRNGALYNDLGVIYAEAGLWVPARDAFIAAVQANPAEGSYHRNLAQVMVELGDYDMALSEYEAYRRLDLEGGQDSFRLSGEALRRAGRAEEAAARFREGLKVVRDRAEKLRLALSLARLEQERGQSQQAREALAGQLKLARNVLAEQAGGAAAQPGSAEGGTAEAAEAAADSLLASAPGTNAEEQVPLARAVIDRLLALQVEDARVLAESGLPAEAAALYRDAWRTSPEQTDLLPLIVGQYLQADQVADAREVVAEARQQAPRAKGTWLAAGLVDEQEGRYQDAIASYRRAAVIDPEDRDIDLKLGSVYVKTGDTAAAEEHLARGITSDKATPEFVYNYGVSLLREKKYGEAAEAFRRVVDKAPQMGQAWQALATSLRLAGSYDEAADAYRHALEFGDDPKLHFNLAFSLSRSGDQDEAIAQYRRAIELDPTFSEAHYNLSRLLIQAGRYEEALTALDRFLQIEPDSYRILFNQGLALYHLGRYEEAIEKYEAALEQQETADVLNNLGLVYDKLGEKDEARSYYAAARDLKGAGR